MDVLDTDLMIYSGIQFTIAPLLLTYILGAGSYRRPD